jgi:hypothetical protein
MPQTDLGIVYPDRDSTHPSEEWWKQLALTANAAIKDSIAGSGVFRGLVAEGTDVNTLRAPGIYTVPTVTVAGTLLNYPTTRAGIIVVWTNAGSSVTTQTVIAMVSTTAPTEMHTRATISATNTAWCPWSSPEWVKGTLTGTADARVNVDTFRSPGAWVVSSTAYVDGLPAGAKTGMLENVVPPSGSSLALQRYTERVANSDVRVHHRFTLLSSGWAGVAWQLANAPSPGSDAPTADVQVSDHASRVEYARTRRGGGTGTGGRAVVMLRFDHWLEAFRDKVLPILREYSLPGTLNVNYDNLGNAQNGGGTITWADVQAWNQYDGVEIANHGSTHSDVTTAASIYHEVVDGRRNLEAAMPRVAVETWHEHGSAYLTASDVPGDGGLNLGRTLSSFTESYAGRLVMAEHAVVEGKCGGFFVPLAGTPQIGQSHMSVDQPALLDGIAQVENAKTFGRGVTLYLHPGLLDTVLVNGQTWNVVRNPDGSVDVTDPDTSTTTSYATEADFQAWADAGGHTVYLDTGRFRALCAHLAAERAAGRIMVMTAAGGAFADKSHSRRENLLVKADFTTGYETWWTNRTGWTVTNPGPDVVLTSGGTAVPLTQGMLLHSRFGWAMGAAHELVVRAKASAATTLTLSVEQTGNPANWKAERVHAVPGDGTVREYRLNLTLPRDPSITQMTVRLGGANLTIEGAPLLAAI